MRASSKNGRPVLLQTLPFAPHQTDRIDLKQHTEPAALGTDFRIEDVHLAVGDRISLHFIRMFVDQIAQIGRSETVLSLTRERHQHGPSLFAMVGSQALP
jgi:hypothetical protein